MLDLVENEIISNNNLNKILFCNNSYVIASFVENMQISSFTPWFSNKSIISTWKMGYEQCICLVNCKEFYVFIVQTPSFTTVFGTYPALHVSLKLSLRVEFNK